MADTPLLCANCNKPIPYQTRAVTVFYRQTVIIDGRDCDIAERHERTYCRVCYLDGAADMGEWSVTTRRGFKAVPKND